MKIKSQNYLMKNLFTKFILLLLLCVASVGQAWATYYLMKTNGQRGTGAEYRGSSIATFSGNNPYTTTWQSDTEGTVYVYVTNNPDGGNDYLNYSPRHELSNNFGDEKFVWNYNGGTNGQYDHSQYFTAQEHGWYTFSFRTDNDGNGYIKCYPWIIVGNGTGNWLNGVFWDLGKDVRNTALSSKTYSNCPAGIKSFRIIPYGAYDTAHGNNQVTSCNVEHWSHEDNNVTFTTIAPADITIGFDGTNITVNVSYTSDNWDTAIKSILDSTQVMFYYGKDDSWGDDTQTMYVNNSSAADYYSSPSIHTEGKRLAVAVVNRGQYYIAQDNLWAGVQMNSAAKAGAKYWLSGSNVLNVTNGSLPTWTSSTNISIAKGTTSSELAATCSNSSLGRTNSISYYHTQDGGTTWTQFDPTDAEDLEVGEYTVRALAHDGNIYVRTATAATLKVYANITLNNHEATSAGTTSVQAEKGASAENIDVPKKTGYTFQGYYTGENGSGTLVINDDGSWVANNSGYTDNSLPCKYAATANHELHAYWTANNYIVTLDVDEPNQGDIASATTSQGVSYDGATTTVPDLPTAANGYCFMGFFTAASGGGVQVINANGTWIASVTGYTDGDKKWVHDGDVTLYAYYKKAKITNIAFTGSAVVAPSTSVTVTPTISPTPTGTTTVCWRVLYSNDNPLAEQPSFTPGVGSAVSFTSPAEGGAYKLEAVLHAGSGCGGATLDSVVANFQVAAEHTVTVQYKDASGNTIQASGTVTGKPLEWSSVTAPDIFGYTFHHWLAGDGITLSENGEDAKTGARADSSVVNPIYIEAVYDGRLTAVYNKKKLIYLDLSETFSTSGKWSNPYAYFYTSDGFWDETNGAGAVGDACVGKGAMTNIEGTDIWYYDYGSVENFGNKLAFTWGDHLTAIHFSGIDAIYRTDFSEGTPLFVPLVGQTPIEKNTPSAKYYNAGYWVTYHGEKTGYTLRIKNSSTHELIKEVPFTSETKRITMTAVTDLEASHTYEFEIMRDNGKYYKNVNQRNYSNRNDNWKYIEADNIGTILTTASGDYTFTLGYADYNNDHDYQLRVNIKYPVATNDYRLIYKDDVHTGFKPSAVVVNKPGSTDIVSFFVRPNSNPILYKQTASVAGDGAITWTTTETNLITAAMKSAVITKDSVYNFNLVMDEGGNLSVGGVEAYTGNFYIRTDGANNKWDNYTNIDHMMTYSEYSEKNAGYSHYFMAFVENNTNVKFTIANDYSPCISDTLVQGSDGALMDASGFLYERANVRFMWNRHDNTLSRAYLAAAKDDGTKFLVLRANSSTDMMDKDGNALLESATSGNAGYNHGAPNNSIQFVDNENWIYETTVKVKPSAYVKLYAHYHSADHYYKGVDNDTFDGSNAIQLMTGTGDPELVRVIYDFKTDRLVSAFEPSGNINTERAINADVMFVREHQGDIRQLTFSKGAGDKMGAITEIKTAYAVLRFSKWTLNNKSTEGGHAVLDPLLSRYERDLFYVSFPFRVSMNEVFGFGTYGKHWIIEYYDGEARAANGFWADSPSYWRTVTDRRNKFFEPNQGYIIALDLDELGESSEVWNNGVEQVELYFPSYGTMPNITSSTVTYAIPEHTCTIGPRPGLSDDRTIKDSHWNVMSVPTYVNTSSVEFANTAWNTANDCPNFLYEWNASDNSLTARSGTGYTYHAMHAYIVQYSGNVTWTTSVSPASLIVARERTAPNEVVFRLELSQNEQMIDQTFLRLSNDENASEEFVFGEDLSKEFNKNKANIYTFIGTEQAAGNTLPMREQKTEVPVGVKIAADGDYTFAIPEGTAGVGVTLLDNETGVRTSLSALDYTINLTAGTYNERFVLEISPIVQSPTGIENTEHRTQNTDVRKVLIDNILYIVKDGVMYDARGARVQ